MMRIFAAGFLSLASRADLGSCGAAAVLGLVTE